MSDTVSVVIAILGGFIVLYGLCSLFIKERLYLSEACKKKQNKKELSFPVYLSIRLYII